jgi:DNA polymerase
VNDVRRRGYLEALGIAPLQLRTRVATPIEPAPPPGVPAEQGARARPQGVPLETGAPAPPRGAPTSSPGAPEWPALEAAVRACTLCGLHATRTQTVFGVGRRDAQLFVIGEAPGADEDRQGEPFVGRAGQLLNAMLRSIGFARRDVYIANILKCRPPGNRDPQPSEAASCTPYLEQQLALVAPRVILGLGRIAAQWLLQTDVPIGRLRGQTFRHGERGTPLIVTYHPAYLLRSPLAKATAWKDLCVVRDMLEKGR